MKNKTFRSVPKFSFQKSLESHRVCARFQAHKAKLIYNVNADLAQKF